MTSNQTLDAQAGIVISTAIAAGTVWPQHVEGIVLATAISAGGAAIASNHVDALVVR